MVDRKMVVLICGLLLLAGSVGCAGTASPAGTALVTQEALSPPLTSPPPATALPSASATPEVTSTPLPTPSAPPTLTPALEGERPVASAEDELGQRVEAFRSRSPYGPWEALVLYIFQVNMQGALQGDEYTVQVRLHDFELGEALTILDEARPFALGATFPVVLGWSADGTALWLADRGVPDGCGAPFKENVQRVALPAGELSPWTGDFGRDPTLSPDGHWLGWVADGSLWLAPVDGSQRRQIPLPLDDSRGWSGDVAWSPDSAAVLLPLWLDPCTGLPGPDQELLLVHLESEQVVAIEADATGRLVVASWPRPGSALLTDAQGINWWLELPAVMLSATPPPDWVAATAALQEFFSALAEGSYVETQALFGGDLSVLAGYNPDIAPDDTQTLWQRACQQNGFMCLPLREVLPLAQPEADRYQFQVSFSLDDEMFVLGPCCGASPVEMPPQSQFIYTVARTPSGEYRVLELPPYVP